MSLTFTKLFSSITESTIWMEDDATRLAWIAMLAMADRRGRVFASIPGLANRARISVESCDAAIVKFLSPDTYSRTPLYEGRRIAPIDGGWVLLNHSKYREIRDEEAIRESKRKYINDRRQRERAAKMGVELPVEKVGQGRDNAEADSEAEAEAKKRGSKRFAPPSLEEAEKLAAARGLPCGEGQAFIDHHATNGWVMKNGRKMANVGAAMGTWARNYFRFHPQAVSRAPLEAAKSKYEESAS